MPYEGLHWWVCSGCKECCSCKAMPTMKGMQRRQHSINGARNAAGGQCAVNTARDDARDAGGAIAVNNARDAGGAVCLLGTQQGQFDAYNARDATGAIW
eukprot:1146814-Pelagomonas_calceolata.AAC.7